MQTGEEVSFIKKPNPPGEEPAGFIDYSPESRLDLFSVLKLFPVPMEVFSPDGVSLFINQAFVDFFRISAQEIVGKLNILNDTYIYQTLGL